MLWGVAQLLVTTPGLCVSESAFDSLLMFSKKFES